LRITAAIFRKIAAFRFPVLPSVVRIIAGEYRRRLLETPADAEVTRPIPDRVKESLFMLLRGHFEGANVFDGFAGTGAIGLEAVSRGAAHCVFAEKHPTIAGILERNIETLGCGDRCEIVRGDALGPGAIARCPRPLTLAFLDPPYPLVREAIGYKRVMAQMKALVSLLSDDGYAILRLPHPLWVSRAAPGATEVAEPVRRKKGKDRNAWKRELLDDRPRRKNRSTHEEEDSVDGAVQDSGQQSGESQSAEIEKDLADLKVEGAVGPESHVYHNMAVHFYMRDRSVSAGS
jgi:16S rRNA (guanine(966)-N(2))-methyltransferase RsmD